jgi:hypothetical protein
VDLLKNAGPVIRRSTDNTRSCDVPEVAGLEVWLHRREAAPRLSTKWVSAVELRFIALAG